VELALDIKEQIKHENRIAASWLIHYRERKRSHDELYQEIIAGTKEKDENIGGGRSGVGRPVEAMAIKLEAHNTGDMARWLLVVEDVKSILGPKKRQLLELRQECRFYISPDGGRPGWIAPVQQRFGEITGWCPSEDKIKEMWYEVVNLTVRVAAMHKCKF